MANAALHENGTTCPACELRREEANRGFTGKANVPCNNCGGTGRVAFDPHQIIAGSVRWAREHYWPERERRWAAENARKGMA